MSEQGTTPENEEIQAAAEGPDEGDTASSLDLMGRELEQARQKAEENWDLLLRARAELENLKRRHDRDLEKARKFAVERFVSDLLPVLDSMELGLAAAKEEGVAIERIREGVDLTNKQLLSALEKNGVQSVDPSGQPFNPDHHQAMTMQESAEHDPNTVLFVMQKGYLLNDRLVRPAMVAVSRPPADAAPKIDEQA